MLIFIPTPFFSFDEDAIVFECRYARTVNANSGVSVYRPYIEPISDHGDLTYNMNIVPGEVGGESVIELFPNHNVAGIGARYGYVKNASDSDELYD